MDKEKLLPQQVIDSINEIGLKETASILARSLIMIAHSANEDIQFECDQGDLTIKRVKIAANKTH